MLLISYGTRPEWLKIKPLVEKLPEGSFRLIFTGQHKDLINQKELKSYEIVDYEHDLDNEIRPLTVGESCQNRLDFIIIALLNNNHTFHQITHVMVQGDTTSAFAIALAAFHRQIPVIHLEAGLRTYDKRNPYPEEFNRTAISKIADIHFCPTENNKDNLRKEGITGRQYVVGNTIIDSLPHIKPTITNNVLVTLHRRENHDLMAKWFSEIEKLAFENQSLRFFLPLHPNPNVSKHRDIFQYVNVIDPISHEECCKRIAEAKLIITDSGGIQEEACFYKKRTIVCRKVTERMESVLSGLSVLCSFPEELRGIFYRILYNCINTYNPHHYAACPYGDGKASEKIVRILKQEKVI